MSKSKGNVMDPLLLSDQYGADALRFTLAAMAAQGRDIKLAESRIEGYRNFATKIWNACRFLEMNGCKPAHDLDYASVKDPTNIWIISSLAETEEKTRKAIEEYRFNEAADTIYKFIWNSYCDWYLELIKPVLSGGDDVDAALAEETKQVASRVIADAIRLLHPFMPFITEELWENVFAGEGMLISSAWPEIKANSGQDAASEIAFVVELITNMRSIRNEMNVPAAAKPNLVLVATSADLGAIIDRNRAQIERLARVENISDVDTAPEQSAQGLAQSGGLSVEFAIPLAGILDFDAERARLGKDIKAAEGEIKKLEGKLNNQGFLAKAPDDVVEENRRRLAQEIETRDRLSLALERLG